MEVFFAALTFDFIVYPIEQVINCVSENTKQYELSHYYNIQDKTKPHSILQLNLKKTSSPQIVINMYD